MSAPVMDDFDLDIHFGEAIVFEAGGPTDTIDSHRYSCGRACTSESDYCPPLDNR